MNASGGFYKQGGSHDSDRNRRKSGKIRFQNQTH